MREPAIPNKYNLDFYDISKLRVVNRTIIKQKYIYPFIFWYNDYIKAWCTTFSYGDISAGFCMYDNDSCGYWIHDASDGWKPEPTEFYNPNEIHYEEELKIQEDFLKLINWLLDEGVVRMDTYNNDNNTDKYRGIDIPNAKEFYSEFKRREKMKYETALKKLLETTSNAISVAIANSTLPICINLYNIEVDNQHSVGYYWNDIKDEYNSLMEQRGWRVRFENVSSMKQVYITTKDFEEENENG